MAFRNPEYFRTLQMFGMFEDQSLECTSDRVVDDPLGVLFVDAFLKTIRSLID